MAPEMDVGEGVNMGKHRTEEVYDTEMSPLIAQLIAIAKREKIPLLISAGMLNDEGGPMTCDTRLSHAEKFAPGLDNRHGLAFEVIRGHSGFDTAAGLMITRHHDGTPHVPTMAITVTGGGAA